MSFHAWNPVANRRWPRQPGGVYRRKDRADILPNARQSLARFDAAKLRQAVVDYGSAATRRLVRD